MALPEHFQDLSLSSEAGGGLTDPNTSALSLPSGDALRAFLEQQGEAVDSLLAKPYVAPPKLDTSRPLRDYFISSSHNTYLLANQLTGKSDASAYASVVSPAPSRLLPAASAAPLLPRPARGREASSFSASAGPWEMS